MGHVSGGKRAGSRRAARPARRFRPDVLLLALGITLAVVAWGYLVYAAIDFGGDARDGDTQSWALLGLAAIGAVACLFIGLMLIARLSRALGLSSTAPPRAPRPRRPSDPAGSVEAVEQERSHRHRAP